MKVITSLQDRNIAKRPHINNGKGPGLTAVKKLLMLLLFFMAIAHGG